MGLQEQYDSYKNKYRYYRNKKTQLKSAYRKISNVKTIHKTGENKLSQCTKGIKWKGQQAKKFNTMLDELNIAVDIHREKIDIIQDGINTEANRANDNMYNYNNLATGILKTLQDLSTAVQNQTNG